MTAKHYIIIFDNEVTKELEDEFLEVIRSTFPSKKMGSYHAIAISASADYTSPKELHEKISSIFKKEINFLIINMASYYGNLSPDYIDWVKTNFHTLKIID